MNHEIRLIETERIPFAQGHVFGKHGAYERIKGQVHFSIDPKADAFSGITDLENAPTNDKGWVDYRADFMILRPSQANHGNQRIFFDWGNRGNIRCLQFFNDAIGSNNPCDLAHAGNGFLFRRGYTLVFGAWQGDLLAGDGRLLLQVPVASENGKPLQGLVRSEFILEQAGMTTQPLSGWASSRSYPTVSLDTKQATLTRRPYADAPRQTLSPDQWMFARNEGGIGLDGASRQTAIVPSDSHLYLPEGFQTGWIYELIYTGKDPLVLGLGHPAVRDLISFLKYETADAEGTPNPLLDLQIEKAYGWGRSQTGRAIRDFVHQGYNADSQGRKVFDGLLPHVSGGGLLWMNHRFANPISPAGQEHETHENCADRFPFAYTECTDHLTGKTDAILKRPNTDPLILHTQTATEYWQRRGSLVHTDTQGNDLEPPDNVRIYCWGSSQHFADPQLVSPDKGICQNLSNVVRTSMFFRALLDRMEQWATAGTPPPPSQYPLRKKGTLLTGEEWRKSFPAIPGLALPRGPAKLPLLDFGPNFEKGLLSEEPPRVVDEKGYPTLVPAVDCDGNDIGCLRAPMVAAPLATYTGWNLRGRGQGHGAKYLFSGATIPFSETPEERKATADPRPAILERYRTQQDYVDAIRKAAELLVETGYLLEEDVQRCADWAKHWDRQRHHLSLV